jgi:uncharacterized protein YyaL (SSP411 family)
MAWGLIELYEATFAPRYLKEALNLVEYANEHFLDSRGGGYFLTSNNAEDVLVRNKDWYDGAYPSGNSAMYLDLVRLARLTGRTDLEKQAGDMMTTISGRMKENPTAYALSLCALDYHLGPGYEVVIVGNKLTDDIEDTVNIINRNFMPSLTILFCPEGKQAHEISTIADFTTPMKTIDNLPTYYLCHDFTCDTPTTDPAALLKNLNIKK